MVYIFLCRYFLFHTAAGFKYMRLCARRRSEMPTTFLSGKVKLVQFVCAQKCFKAFCALWSDIDIAGSTGHIKSLLSIPPSLASQRKKIFLNSNSSIFEPLQIESSSAVRSKINRNFNRRWIEIGPWKILKWNFHIFSAPTKIEQTRLYNLFSTKVGKMGVDTLALSQDGTQTLSKYRFTRAENTLTHFTSYCASFSLAAHSNQRKYLRNFSISRMTE